MYVWLPEGARLWGKPESGLPGTGARLVFALVLLGVLHWATGIPLDWVAGGSVAILLLSLLARPLRRRGTRPEGGGWLVLAPGRATAVFPAGPAGPAAKADVDGPALRVDIEAPGVRLLGATRSAAAIRSARALLVAADREPEALAAIGVGAIPDEGAGSAGERAAGPQLVLHDERTAAVLSGAEPRAAEDTGDSDARDTGRSRHELLSELADSLGTAVPSLTPHPGRIPAELTVTADDVRAWAAAGLASARRLELEFTGVAVPAPCDVALGLDRVRAWPSRYDGLTVGSLAGLDPGAVADGLRTDLARQAAADRAREEREPDQDEPLTGLWEERWQPYLDRLGVRDHRPGSVPDKPGAAGAPGLSPTGRAALLLARTAAAATGSPLPGEQPSAVRRIEWPGGRVGARAGDMLLRLCVLAVPLGLGLAWGLGFRG
ncbi:hypothetical protein [Streptomyces gobiensis]|uniref:hypothetical protein n=1 Tax=Streptomyces gobiensis TaxID=2875706 RepID=UPI001E3B0F58|nr:hypothetical protein [Streptomyces gobiensis]UGY94708.1 hypothetical protein test1122_25225 [Streptomyces gobiensis]